MTTVQSAGPETKAAGARTRAVSRESESELHPFHGVNGQRCSSAWGSDRIHSSLPSAAHPLARLHRSLASRHEAAFLITDQAAWGIWIEMIREMPGCSMVTP